MRTPCGTRRQTLSAPRPWGNGSTSPIRALLLNLLPYEIKNEVIRADREGRDGPVNDFISLLIERSAGFPQYIVYAAREIVAGRISIQDGERCRDYIPAGLTNYQEKLIEELDVDHDDRALRPIVNVLIALSREPMTAGMLRAVLAEVGEWRSISEADVERLLQSIGQLLSMRRLGTDVVYEPFTYALREQIVEFPERKHLVQQGRSLFAHLERERSGKLGNYRLRHGVQHLLELADSLWKLGERQEAEEFAARAMHDFCDFSTLMKRLDKFGKNELDILETYTDSNALYACYDKFGMTVEDDDAAMHTYLSLVKPLLIQCSSADCPARRIFLQLAMELAETHPLARAADAWLAEGNCDWFWLRNTGETQRRH